MVRKGLPNVERSSESAIYAKRSHRILVTSVSLIIGSRCARWINRAKNLLPHPNSKNSTFHVAKNFSDRDGSTESHPISHQASQHHSLYIVRPKLLLLVHALLMIILCIKWISYISLKPKITPISFLLHSTHNSNYNRHVTSKNNFQLSFPFPSLPRGRWWKV